MSQILAQNFISSVFYILRFYRILHLRYYTFLSQKHVPPPSSPQVETALKESIDLKKNSSKVGIDKLVTIIYFDLIYIYKSIFPFKGPQSCSNQLKVPCANKFSVFEELELVKKIVPESSVCILPCFVNSGQILTLSIF
jgi:hypothetical protein